MATRYEYNDIGDNYDGRVAQGWFAQTFTPLESHRLTLLALKMWRLNFPGPLVINIRATDAAGNPTGPVLSTVTIDGNTLTDIEPGLRYEIPVPPIDVFAGTKYAIELNAISAPGGEYVMWRLALSGTYPRGNALDSGDAITWTAWPFYDFIFEEWGDPIGAPPGSPPVAGFTATPASGNAPLDVQFTDTSTGNISTWLWDFGDGQYSDLQNPAHRFVNSGTYRVTLTVTGPDGTDQAYFDIQVSAVGTGYPTTPGILTLVPTYICIGAYANFTGDDNGNNDAYMEYRRVGDTLWKRAIRMTADRRTTVMGMANPYYNQWRSSIFGLLPNTEYEVRVTFSDPDGVNGTNPVVATITTRNDEPPSVGNTYYVSLTTGNDINGDGSITNPWQTIQRGVNQLNPGDTLYVRGGTYIENQEVLVSRSGLPDNWITIRAYEGEVVTIDASFNTHQVGYVGFTAGVHITSNYLRWKGINVLGSQLGIYVGPISYEGPENPGDIIIEDCVFDDGKTLQSLPDDYSGVFMGTGGNSWMSGVHNVTIRRCTMFLHEPGAIDVQPATGPAIGMRNANGGHVFADNRIYFTGTVPLGKHGSDGINNGPNVGSLNTLQDSDIYGNTVEGATDDTMSFDGNGCHVRLWENRFSRGNTFVSIAPVIVGPVYVIKNVMFDLQDHWTGSPFAVKGVRDGTGHVYFYNNTIVTPERTMGGRTTPIIYGWNLLADEGVGVNIYLANNIVEVDGPVVANAGGAWPQMDYDMIYNAFTQIARDYWARYGSGTYGSRLNTNEQNFAIFQAGTGQETHGIGGRATFVDRANKDFRLAMGSLGIGTGVIIPGINDIGDPWPYTGAPNMGAYENDATPEPPPTAAFTAAPVDGMAPLSVQFTDQSSGVVSSRQWDFGDGGTSTEVNPTHIYQVPGIYTPTLTVTGPGGSSSLTGLSITVAAPPAVLTLAITGQGVTDPPPGIHSYLEGTVVSLNATPTAGWQFDHWVGPVVQPSSATTTITMSGSQSVTAVFTESSQPPPTTYNVTISHGSGGHTEPPAGNYPIEQDNGMLVTAIPDSGYDFYSWMVNGVEYTGNATILIQPTEDTTAVASFVAVTPPPAKYTVVMSVIGDGTTDPAPGAWDVDQNASLPIAAYPGSGWKFDHWEGAHTGSKNPDTVQVTTNMSITAVFSRKALGLDTVLTIGGLLMGIVSVISSLKGGKK